MADKKARYIIEVIDKATATLDKIKTKLEAVDRSLGNMGGGKLKASSSQFQKSMQRNAKATKTFERSTRRLSGTIQTLGNTLSITGTLGFIGLTQVTRLAITSFTSFEDKMAELKAVTQGTNTEMASLKNTALTLADTSKFSATQTAEALVQLTRGGLSAGQAMKALEPAINLATAGNIELGEASDIVTNIMSGFKIGADGLTMTVDQLAKAASMANTNIGQIGKAFSFAAGTARSFGVPMERANAILLAFAKSGEKSGRAGRSLRRVLNALGKSDIRKKLADLGVSVTKTSEIFDVIRQIEQKGISSEGLSNALGNVELAGNFNALLAVGSEKLVEFENNIRNSTGTARTMADVMRNTLGGDLETLRSRLESLAIQFIEHFAPTLRSITKGIIQFVDWLKGSKNLLSLLAKTIMKVIKFYAVFKTTLMLTNVVMKASRFTMVAYRLTMIATQFGIAGVTRALAAMNTMLMANPWGIAIAGLTAVIALFVDFNSFVDDANTGLDELQERKKQWEQQTERIRRQADALEDLNKAQKEVTKNEVLSQIAELEKQQASLLGQRKKFGAMSDADAKMQAYQNIYASGKFRDRIVPDLVVKGEMSKITGRNPFGDFGGEPTGMIRPEDLEKVNKQLEERRQILAKINQSIKSTPDGVDPNGTSELSSETNKVTGSAPRVFNVNIDKLVEAFTVQSTTIEGAAEDVKERITEVLIDAVRQSSVGFAR